ncbi:MAG: MotA/TolQ/ExbB proton channel family protein [Phycisphaeraceae bacterium]
MASNWQEAFWSLMDRGGPVMWPLAALSVLSLAVILERLWFLLRLAGPGSAAEAERLTQSVAGDEAIVPKGASIYADLLFSVGEKRKAAAVQSALMTQRTRLERFLSFLSVVVTISPMLGILGTVLGIIDSFEVLSGADRGLDPADVGAGIAEALITTAAGLMVAVGALVGYQLLGGWVRRVQTRLEILADALIRA